MQKEIRLPLGLEVVAEGVEHEEQVATLDKFACDYVQGFLFSKPASADVLRELPEATTRLK